MDRSDIVIGTRQAPVTAMRIAFIYPPGRLKRLDAAHAHQGPSDFFFGDIEAEQTAIVQHVEVDSSAGLSGEPPHTRHAAEFPPRPRSSRCH